MSVGIKIKQLRLALHMTQRELAGQELTRSFICQIETGRSLPSLESLSVIAKRLNKPVDYFLQESDHTDTVIECLEQSNMLLESRRCKEALQTAQRAVNLSNLINDPTLSSKSKIIAAKALFCLESFEEAITYFEDVVESELINRKSRLLIESLYWLGSCCFRMQEYRQAVRYYKRALLKSEGLKSELHYRSRSLAYLATSLYRLGDFEPAQKHYLQIWMGIEYQEDYKILIESGIGLSLILNATGKIDEAVNMINKAHKLSRDHHDHLLVRIEHNLGVYLLKTTKKQEALKLLYRCLDQYVEHGDLISQVSILEEISSYYLSIENYPQFYAILNEALNKCNILSHSIQLGRLYRLNAQALKKEGKTAESQSYIKLASNLFLSSGALAEVKNTIQLMDDV